MNELKNRRRQIFANKMHRDILLLIFFASLLPMTIVAICLYYLIFSITAAELGIPEIIAYNIIPAAKKVTKILAALAPVSIIVILIFAHKITHKIIGPFNRIVKELDESIEGRRQGPIVIRKNDRFWPLVEKINKLLDKVK